MGKLQFLIQKIEIFYNFWSSKPLIQIGFRLDSDPDRTFKHGSATLGEGIDKDCPQRWSSIERACRLKYYLIKTKRASYSSTSLQGSLFILDATLQSFYLGAKKPGILCLRLILGRPLCSVSFFTVYHIKDSKMVVRRQLPLVYWPSQRYSYTYWRQRGQLGSVLVDMFNI